MYDTLILSESFKGPKTMFILHCLVYCYEQLGKINAGYSKEHNILRHNQFHIYGHGVWVEKAFESLFQDLQPTEAKALGETASQGPHS